MGPKVSVVTVSYNAAQCIAETIESVLVQTYTDYEYIFIDGQSTDETVSIIESYRSNFEAKGIPYLVVSEKDAGIYDAMNKGVSRSRGKWIQMLNAGDYLVDENVFKDVFLACEKNTDVIYGDTILHDGGYYKLIEAGSLETITREMPFCHQSVFVERNILVECGFDIKYKYAADYDQLLCSYLAGKQFQHFHRPIAVYDTSGESEKNFKMTIHEQNSIRSSYGIVQKKPIFYTLMQRVRARLLKKFLPMVARSEIRGWYRTLDDIKRWYNIERFGKSE